MAAIDLNTGQQINFPYTAVDLTAEINVIPNMYGRLNEMNLMPGEGVSTTLVEVSFEQGVLTILPTRERGAEPTVGRTNEATSIFLKVPHIPHMDTIKPEDMQDKFAFGSGRQRKMGVADAVAKKLLHIRNKHAITLEFMRMGALKGKIIDGANTELYDLFDVFGIEEKVVDFALDNDATDVRAKCYEVVRHIEDNLTGEVMTGVRSLVKGDFFDALVSHPNVEKFYVNFAEAAQLRGDDIRKGFTFGGITFEEYRGVASDSTGATRPFIASGDGHAFPVGTMQTFGTSFAPANHVQMVNTLGTEIFVSPKILDHGQGVELRSESNPLPICRRPALLVKMTA